MKQKNESIFLKKIIVVLLSIAMIAGLIPVIDNTLAVQAADGPKVRTINMGIGGIHNPSRPDSQEDKWADGDGSFVYFGKYAQSDTTGEMKEPIKWRVLDTENDSLLLLSDQVLDRVLFNEEILAGNKWSTSNIRKWLNSEEYEDDYYGYTADGFLDTAFGSVEKAAIKKTSKAEGSPVFAFDNQLDAPALEDDEVFLLSAEEVNTAAYGFYYAGEPDSDNHTRVFTLTDYAEAQGVDLSYDEHRRVYWWTRSALMSDSDRAGIVDQFGFFNDVRVSTCYVGVSPALNLNHSSVLFTSAAGTEKSSFAMTGDGSSSAVWNLTLADGNDGFAATRKADETDHVSPGDTVTVEITDIGTPGAGINYTGISAMLLDGDGTVAAYGMISDQLVTGEVAITLPSNLADGTYSLKVFAEEMNSSASSNAVDYASNIVTIGNLVVETAWTVNINSVNTNMTTTNLEIQKVVQGNSIQVITYTADRDYYVPETYTVESQNNVVVTRVSNRQVTVSGIPSGDTNIILPPATEKEAQGEPGVSGDIERITGTTTAMEYAATADAAVWITCDDVSTLKGGGIWYVRYKETETKKAGAIQKVIVGAKETGQNDADEDKNVSGIQTGDDAQAGLWLMLLAVTAVYVLLQRKRTKKLG